MNRDSGPDGRSAQAATPTNSPLDASVESHPRFGPNPALVFLRVEVGAGLLVGVGSIAFAVPPWDHRVPASSALLLSPIAVLLAYGLLVLADRPARERGAALTENERRLVRRRVTGWALMTLAAAALPSDGAWALFIGGSLTVLYACWQLRHVWGRE